MYAFFTSSPRPNKREREREREFTRVIDKHVRFLPPVLAQTRQRERDRDRDRDRDRQTDRDRESLKCERGSSVGREMDRELMPGATLKQIDTDGSIPRCGKGFFSPTQLSVQW